MRAAAAGGGAAPKADLTVAPEDDAEPLFGSSESDADDDSEDDSDDSSDDDEDEDAAQDFKLESFVDVFVGMEKIGISVVVPYDTADSVSYRANGRPEAAPTEIERWPLAMAYGLEGVGRSGFFTMNFEVKDVCDTLRRTCYARLDRTALTRELDHNVPQFVAQWLDVADALEEASAGKRAALFSPVHIFDSRETNERAFAEALFDFFEYGSLRAPVGVRPACAVLDAPRVTLATHHDRRWSSSWRRRRSRRTWPGPRSWRWLGCCVPADPVCTPRTGLLSSFPPPPVAKCPLSKK